MNPYAQTWPERIAEAILKPVIWLACGIFMLANDAHCGQSIEYGAQAVYNETIPTIDTNNTEEWVCWTTASTYTHVLGGPGGAFGNGAVGWVVYFQVGPPLSLSMSNVWDNGTGTILNLSGSTGCVLLRLQHDKPHLLDDYEAWDLFGNNLLSISLPYTSETDAGIGIDLGNTGEPTVSVAFLRSSTALVPLLSIPPTTFSSDPNRVFEYKFDGTLSDSTGNGYTALFTSGSPTYITTLNQSPPISVIQANNTAYAQVTSVRAGAKVPLNGAASYSQADTSATVTYLWQQLSGPSTWAWPNGHTPATPQPIGSIWGDYVVQLTVADVNGVTGISQTDVGSVAQDSKCITVNADPNADIVFGYLIAYGCNPWGFSDQWENGAVYARCTGAYGMTSDCNPAPSTPFSFAALQWTKTGAGTVSYVWGGVGPSGGFPGQVCNNTLVGNITTSQTTIPISNASCLDLTSYPTHIVVGTGGSAEDIRITGSTATSGAATLTVAYNGRGYLSPATAWTGGSPIQQFKVTGSGTDFIGDPTAPVCPMGAATPTGPAYYSTGTVGLTAGSTAVTSSGATFTSTMAGAILVVTSATHSSTPFVFVSPISSTTSTTLTLSEPYPSTADAGSYSYAITYPPSAPNHGQRTLVLRAPHRTDTTATGTYLWNASGCESATSLYLNPWTFGNEFGSGTAPGFNTGTTYSSLPYSVTDTAGYIANSPGGGINFYGESGAWRKLALRSGLTSAMNAANLIDDNLLDSPWGNPDVNSYYELITGGAAIMGTNAAILGAGTGPGSGHGASWGTIRSYAQIGYNNITGIYNGGSIQCWQQDTRSNSYAEAWLVLAALYDPNPTWQAQWQSDLALMETVDSTCHQSDYSWSQSFLCCSGSFAFGPVTLANNSTAMTGTLTLNGGGSACTGTAYGTGTVVNGSGTLTISSTTAGSMSGSDSIAVTGTMISAPYTIQVMYSGSGGTVQLAGLWPGDTGSVTWMSVNTQSQNANLTSYGTGNADTTDLIQNYDCYVTGGSTAVLDHPWAGSNGSAYTGLLYVVSGYGQQPFYNGINAYRLWLMAKSSLPAASTYQGFLNNTVAWIKNTGFNATGLYVDYGAVFSFCATGNLLVTNTAAANTLPQLSPGCNYPIQPTQPTYLADDRAQNSELGAACSTYYQANTTSGNKTFCDEVYGAVWGNQSYNTGGVYYDQYSSALTTNFASTTLSSVDQGAQKWPGFHCGIGWCDEWAAFRLGGVDPANIKTIDVSYSLAGVTGASKVTMTVTEPDGMATPITCTSSPCAVSVDFRQGNPNLEIDVLNSSSVVIAKGDSTTWHIVTP